MIRGRKLLWIVASVCAAILVIGCGAPRSSLEAEGSAPMGMDQAVTAEVASTKSAAAPIPESPRQIIRRGNLVVRVPDLRAAESKASSAATQARGYVESVQTNNLTESVSTVTMVLRVPSHRFAELMTSFEAYGEILHKSISTEDITTQVVDMEARLRVMRAQEEVYLGLLRQSKSLRDSLAVQEQLMRLRQEIESQESILKAQKDQAAMSTLTLEFRSAAAQVPQVPKDWASEAWNQGVNQLSASSRWLAASLVYGAVIAPLWLPPVVLVGWWIRRRRKKRGAPPAPSASLE